MSIIQVQRPKSSLEALSESVSDLTKYITQLKIQQGQRQINEAVTNAIAAGGGAQQIAQAVSSVRQQPQKGGFASSILAPFNPNIPLFTGTSDTENLINQLGIRQAMESPMDRRYQQARTEYMENRAAAEPAAEKLKPLASTEIKRHTDAMDLLLKGLRRKLSTRGTEYSSENVNAAWQNYSDAYGIDQYEPNQQHQLKNIFSIKVKSLSGGKSDWEPAMIEGTGQGQITEDRGQMAEGGGQGGFGGMAVPKELEPYWRDMTEEEHREAIVYLRNGGKLSEIIRRLK